MATPNDSKRKRISISALPEYEMKLLSALAFFLGRKTQQQATAALAMYVRQSHDRILTQCEYYAFKLGINKWELLDLIFENPSKAKELLESAGKVHAPDEQDVFADDQ